MSLIIHKPRAFSPLLSQKIFRTKSSWLGNFFKSLYNATYATCISTFTCYAKTPLHDVVYCAQMLVIVKIGIDRTYTAMLHCIDK